MVKKLRETCSSETQDLILEAKTDTNINCLLHEVQSQSGLYVMFDTDEDCHI